MNEDAQRYDAFVAGLNRVTDNDILANDLMRAFRKMQESQAPMEPEFAAALYSNRAELYRLF
ncbi:hypothetical protein EN858_14910 [Mesorhizobium sp. M4B.F.Ca.ET.215.01.1.1]|uniref:hypothetical protein n=1 Tax=unclassified Mesorhizobium TaxID=325217 RepID=UPI001093FE2B|nr:MULTISPECIES: hypothetical protein [unclassified Mesorhizobium]TGQ11210.1 hypothetical protein EN858_14910 [Mesorhizobium sp. M4B.F.Ca.ET.215.01.1.1]TGR04737.1 hypothetical protein EN846_13170 [Mesorhizobium sp. M4B.F.Ca.ET.203.01.1.1]